MPCRGALMTSPNSDPAPVFFLAGRVISCLPLRAGVCPLSKIG